MKFIVTDRVTIQSGIVVRTPYIVVSIYTPTMPRPVIPRRLGLKAVLFTSFHDAEPTEEFALPPDIVLMTLKQAKAIWRFVKRHQAEVGSIVCHCEQGMSRSPAVALALAETLGGDVDYIWDNYQPNQYVYGLMKEAIKAENGSAQLSHIGDNE
jgi:predicted protein tyrosine phosphatase